MRKTPSITVNEISRKLITLKKHFQINSYTETHYMIAYQVINKVRKVLELRRRSRQNRRLKWKKV